MTSSSPDTALDLEAIKARCDESEWYRFAGGLRERDIGYRISPATARQDVRDLLAVVADQAAKLDKVRQAVENGGAISTNNASIRRALSVDLAPSSDAERKQSDRVFGFPTV